MAATYKQLSLFLEGKMCVALIEYFKKKCKMLSMLGVCWLMFQL